MFRRRHQHHWVEQSRTFNLPDPTLTSFKGDMDTVLRFRFGFTVIVQRCETCGWIETSTVIGKIPTTQRG